MDTETNKKVLRLLTAARGHIATPEQFHQGNMARREDGSKGTCIRGDGVAYSLIGSLHRGMVEPDRAGHLVVWASDKVLHAAIDVLYAVSGVPNLTLFSHRPTTTHADVLAVLDGGIARLSPTAPA